MAAQGQVELEKTIQRIARWLMVASGAAIVLMMLQIVADVTMSKLFNDPVDGTSEIVAAYYMVSVVFLPLAYVAYTEGHLVVELFTSWLEGGRLRLLEGLTGLVTLAYLLFFIVFTGVEAVWRTKEGEAWETSVDLVAVWPSRWILPVGIGVMALYVLERLLRIRRGIRPSSGEG